MVNKIDSVTEYVMHSHYRGIGVPIVSLIRHYSLTGDYFDWKWKTTLYTEVDDVKSWKNAFPWYETPLYNYEYGLTKGEMNAIVRQMDDQYSHSSFSYDSNASEFAKLIFNIDNIKDPQLQSDANKDALSLGKWKAKRILKDDAFSNEISNQRILENLQIKAYDIASELIIFTSEFNTPSGFRETIRLVCNKEDYQKRYISEENQGK